MPIFGSLEYMSRVVKDPAFADVFAYLRGFLDLRSSQLAKIKEMASGESRRVSLGGEDFAIESVYDTRRREDAFFESHRKYIDVQFVLEGEEMMETADIASLAISHPYDETADLIKYLTPQQGTSALGIREGMGAIFFPDDGHMPGLWLDPLRPVRIRKTVVKVRVW